MWITTVNLKLVTVWGIIGPDINEFSRNSEEISRNSEEILRNSLGLIFSKCLPLDNTRYYKCYEHKDKWRLSLCGKMDFENNNLRAKVIKYKNQIACTYK